MKKFYPYIVFVLLLCPICSLWADETILVGDVVSAETGEAIANASVYFRGTSIGTATNDEGSFALRTDIRRKHTLVVSAVGYKTESFPVEAGAMAGVQVALKEKTAILDEVFATPGENMALPLIKSVRQHREQNDRVRLGLVSASPKVTELFISQIERKHLQRRLWKNLQSGMIMQGDSTYLLPLYSSEKGALVLSETDYESLLTDDGDLNFYDTEVSLMGRSFLSPLAQSGPSYYQYYLSDSIIKDGGKSYVVHFKTKNPFYETFNGELVVDSASYAIESVYAEVPRQSGVNYLRGAQIHQSYAADRSLQYEKIDIILDFAIKTDDSHFFPTVLIAHRIGEEKGSAEGGGGEQNGLSIPSDEMLQNAMDSLTDAPIIRVARWVATVLTTGYMPTGTCVDIGNIHEILEVNPHETVHLGLPLRTNERLWKNVCLEAGVSYGFKDQRWKGYGKVHVMLPSLRRHMMSFEYREGYVWNEEANDFSRLMRENSHGFRLMDFGSHFLETMPYKMKQGLPSTAIYRRQFQLQTEDDWTDNIESQFFLRVGSFPGVYQYQSLGGILRLGWNERKVDLYMRRVHVYSHYPVVYLGAELGSYSGVVGQPSNYHLYGRLNAMLRQQVDLRMAGTLDYSLLAGCVLGQVPYNMLYQFAGGRGHGLDAYRFSQMGNWMYAADKYFVAHAEWNMQGLLFNLIPGVRYLRLRELVIANIGWGTHSKNHWRVQELGFPDAVYENQLRVPHVEIGVGLANILRLVDVVSVWRVTHIHDEAYQGIPYWSIRCRINIGL